MFSFAVSLVLSSFLASTFSYISSIIFIEDGAKKTELLVEEPSAAQYLPTEENGNVISTGMMLVIVDNNLKTFPICFSLYWLHLCSGLDMPHKDTMITLCCIQPALCCPWFSGSCLLIPLNIFSFSTDLKPAAWLNAVPKSHVWPLHLSTSYG